MRRPGSISLALMGGGVLLAGGGVWALSSGRTDCSRPEAQQLAREAPQCVQAQAEGRPDAPELCACHVSSGSGSGGGSHGGHRSGHTSPFLLFGSSGSGSSEGRASPGSSASRGGFGGTGSSFHASGS